jgi:hypothetical protein
MQGRRRWGPLVTAALLAGIVGGSLGLALHSPTGARADDPPGGRLQPPGPRIEQTPGAKDPRRAFTPPPDPSLMGLQVVVTLVPADRAFAALNEGRAAVGKPPLRQSPILAEAARRAAEGMAASACLTRYEGEGNSTFACTGWSADQIKAVARSLGYQGDIAIDMGVQVAIWCDDAYPVTTALPDCVQPYVESALQGFRESVVATGNYSLEAGAYAACGRYSTWTGWTYRADYGCFPVALGGKGAEASAPGPAAPAAPADSSHGGGRPAPAPAAAPPPVPAPTPARAPDSNGSRSAVVPPQVAAEGQGNAPAGEDPLPVEPVAGDNTPALTDGQAAVEIGPSLPGPLPDRLVEGAKGERAGRLPVVGHVAEAWKKMWSAISSLLGQLH